MIKSVVFASILLLPSAVAAQIPTRALQYRDALISNARFVFGLNAPIAVFAAQIHAESAWRPDARSPFASGLAQFIPSTADDISARYRSQLGAAAPLEPSWALRALALYNRDLFKLEPDAASLCDRWAFTLSAYNGGRGWVVRQKAAARTGGSDPARWFGHVENYKVRAQWAHDENRRYPRVILLDFQPRYLAWGVGVDCRV